MAFSCACKEIREMTDGWLFVVGWIHGTEVLICILDASSFSSNFRSFHRNMYNIPYVCILLTVQHSVVDESFNGGVQPTRTRLEARLASAPFSAYSTVSRSSGFMLKFTCKSRCIRRIHSAMGFDGITIVPPPVSGKCGPFPPANANTQIFSNGNEWPSAIWKRLTVLTLDIPQPNLVAPSPFRSETSFVREHFTSEAP